ncbi:hypothetical protein Taro_032306 [Colocasia esculenta]|uniref:Uncharacterized protein n=1 Tax=Colocasia esculenta TaxID=4460 RepID=A0A843VL13_COLES|nr:hypothetical protein [Colocasia esculenta]
MDKKYKGRLDSTTLERIHLPPADKSLPFHPLILSLNFLTIPFQSETLRDLSDKGNPRPSTKEIGLSAALAGTIVRIAPSGTWSSALCEAPSPSEIFWSEFPSRKDEASLPFRRALRPSMPSGISSTSGSSCEPTRQNAPSTEERAAEKGGAVAASLSSSSTPPNIFPFLPVT